MQKERHKITSGGIEIYDYKNPSSHSFFISMFVRGGSMHEDTHGITHFLEHVAIRNVSAIMNGELYSLLDKYGLDFNASTYSDMVWFYISGAKKHFSRAAEIIARLLSPIVLSPSEIRTESERIKAEIRESDERNSLSGFTAGIVHEGTSLARSITGTLASVSGITRKRLEEHRRAIMTRENIFFYVSGSYTDEDLELLSSEIEKYEIPSGKRCESTAPVCEKFGARDTLVHIKNADYTMLRFSFDMDLSRIGFPESDLIYDMLIGGYNSRFFVEMSERRGLFYDISGSDERYRNIGIFSFTFEVKSGSVYDSVELALGILSDFKSRLPGEDELMKSSYVDNAYLLYDDTRDLNFTFAYDNHVIGLDYSDIDARAARYASITPERILECARMLFRPENLTLTVKGKKKRIDLYRIEEIIRRVL